jgi:hypothetical protein
LAEPYIYISNPLFLPFYTLNTENRVLRRILGPKRDEVTGE